MTTTLLNSKALADSSNHNHHHHSYSTRTRHSSAAAASALDDPSLSKPQRTTSIEPDNFPQFPAKGVVLHPEDASSKVLMAIGRSLMSVDNRAMTIKDLSEMTQKFGLMCQNVSAASQAITTYIRSHLQRCEQEQDLPLLLRHNLSGTKADDDLLPALYSRSGGSSSMVNDDRSTSFRRGTAVWYLSRATGAPCPFTRSNIRLCEYAEPPVASSSRAANKREKERSMKERKRKRPTRSCNHKEDDDLSDSPLEGQPPPKYKLTLKFQPLLGKATLQQTPAEPVKEVIDLSHSSDSEEDGSMSVDETDGDEPWALPPYPRRSISIPCYTPTCDSLGAVFFNNLSLTRLTSPRSPSLPIDMASPPPDSDDEEEFSGLHMSSDIESDFDAESPGPRSPSAQPNVDIAVKEEPRMVDSWTDNDDDTVKVEHLDFDGYNPFVTPVKEEPFEFALESGGRDSSPFESSLVLATPPPHVGPPRLGEFSLDTKSFFNPYSFSEYDFDDEVDTNPYLSPSPFSKSLREMSEPIDTPSSTTSLSFMLEEMTMKSPSEQLPPTRLGVDILAPTMSSLDPEMLVHAASSEAIASLLAGLATADVAEGSPSMTEQELFQAFCCIPEEQAASKSFDTDKDEAIVIEDDSDSVPTPPTRASKQARAPPIRRSKRVANAAAARSPIRTRRATRTSTS